MIVRQKHSNQKSQSHLIYNIITGLTSRRSSMKNYIEEFMKDNDLSIDEIFEAEGHAYFVGYEWYIDKMFRLVSVNAEEQKLDDVLAHEELQMLLTGQYKIRKCGETLKHSEALAKLIEPFVLPMTDYPLESIDKEHTYDVVRVASIKKSVEDLVLSDDYEKTQKEYRYVFLENQLKRLYPDEEFLVTHSYDDNYNIRVSFLVNNKLPTAGVVHLDVTIDKIETIVN